MNSLRASLIRDGVDSMDVEDQRVLMLVGWGSWDTLDFEGIGGCLLCMNALAIWGVVSPRGYGLECVWDGDDLCVGVYPAFGPPVRSILMSLGEMPYAGMMQTLRIGMSSEELGQVLLWLDRYWDNQFRGLQP